MLRIPFSSAEIVEDLIEKWNKVRLSAQEKTCIRRQSDSLNDGDCESIESLSESALQAYLKAAVSGYSFVDPVHIKKQLGRTVSQNYPEAGESFLRFANTYWTFQILVYSLEHAQPADVAFGILRDIERIIGALFFPVPGPIRIDPDRRELDQRKLLQQYAPEIAIDDFIHRNPILMRDKLDDKHPLGLEDLQHAPWGSSIAEVHAWEANNPRSAFHLLEQYDDTSSRIAFHGVLIPLKTPMMVSYIVSRDKGVYSVTFVAAGSTAYSFLTDHFLTTLGEPRTVRNGIISWSNGFTTLILQTQGENTVLTIEHNG